MSFRAKARKLRRSKSKKFGKSEKLRSFFPALLHFCVSVLLSLSMVSPLPALTDSEIAFFQKEIADRPIGERIALWAERYVGTPYDPDPLGEYVRRKAIVADDLVDCMYLSFRTVELAMGNTPEGAIEVALEKRFIGRGRLSRDGVVENYEERFQYGEDMLESGKWGVEITGDLGAVSYVEGSRGRERVAMVEKRQLLGDFGEMRGLPLRSGDFIFFVKHPEKRISGEIVGHIGIIKMEGGTPYLIHAGGRKNRGGEVRKVKLHEYITSMPFAGVRVSRFLNP